MALACFYSIQLLLTFLERVVGDEEFKLTMGPEGMTTPEVTLTDSWSETGMEQTKWFVLKKQATEQRWK